MKATTTIWQGSFFDPIDPYPGYRRLRDAGGVHCISRGQWLITSYSEASRLLQDGRCLHWGQDKKAIEHWPPVERAIATTLYALSPDNDRPYRKRILHQLAGSNLMPEEDAMQDLAAQLIQGLKGVEAPDFVRDFAHPFTFRTISRVIGIPEEEQERFGKMVGEMEGGYLACIDPATGRSTLEGREFIQQLQDLIRIKRAEPGDDLCSLLLESSREEPDQETFLLSMLVLVFYAGHFNMMNFLGNGLLALHGQPEVLEQLREEPGLLRKSIDEILRFDSPLQFIMLVAGEELVAGGGDIAGGNGAANGSVIAAGDRILIGVGAANRDPAVFDRSDELMPGRQPRHLSFGTGAFRCIGARLAQLQGYVGLYSWLQHAEGYHPMSGCVEWRTQPFVQRGPAVVPVKKMTKNG